MMRIKKLWGASGYRSWHRESDRRFALKRPGAVCLASGSRAEQRAKRLQKAAMQRGRNWERLAPVNSNE